MYEQNERRWETQLLEKAARLERSLVESFLELDDRFVDPWDAFESPEGGYWKSLGNTSGIREGTFSVYDERFLDEIRKQSRLLALENEFAINALENRINYIVGAGHQYHAVPLGESDAPLAGLVRNLIEEFREDNQWNRRHHEIVRRRDRDGEVFLRLFHGANGKTAIRFVEPEQVSTPRDYQEQKEHEFGIHTRPGDVESVLGYWIDGEYVDVSEIQHRKGNVDFNVKRGFPLLYPVRKNLRRVEKLLRNMSVVAEIQSAIALIRKHAGGTAESLRRYVQGQSDGTVSDPNTGKSRSFQRFSPGTILDAYNGTDYQFPIAAIDASRYIQIVQAELRAIAARLVIPEFMLTSDASNANYSSTMVAEGPAVRMFERLQHEIILEDTDLLRRVIEHAIRCERLPDDTLLRIKLHAVPPMLAVRDRLKEARADEILLKCGVLSAHSMSMRYGLDPSKESKIRSHCDSSCDCGCSRQNHAEKRNGVAHESAPEKE